MIPPLFRLSRAALIRLLLLLAAGGLFTGWMAGRADRALRADLLQHTRAVAQAVKAAASAGMVSRFQPKCSAHSHSSSFSRNPPQPRRTVSRGVSNILMSLNALFAPRVEVVNSPRSIFCSSLIRF